MRVFMCSVLAFVASLSGFAGETYTEKDFSYEVPTGWRLLPPHDKYKIAAGPRKGAVSPNINVTEIIVDREFGMEKFALDVWGNLQLDCPNVKKTAEGPFKSETGLSAMKISMTDVEQGKKVIHYCYLFTGQKKSIIVMCTTTEEDKAAEATFDEVMKGFKILK